MGLRFRKSFKLAPGIRLNVGTKSAGLSFGGKGMRYSINSSGRRTTTVGIPGSGLSYSSTSTSRSGRQYKSGAYSQRNELLKRQREAEKMQEIERNRMEVAMFENRIEIIKSIHKECDDECNWSEIVKREAPYEKGEKGPEEVNAIRLYENYKPGFFAKLFKQAEKEKMKLMNNIDVAKQEDESRYQSWESLVAIANRVVTGDIDAYFEVIEGMAPLDDILEFGSGFEFGTDDPQYMEVEFEVRSEDVVPKEMKSLTQTGKLSVKEMPKTKYFDIQQDYVCSCAIRIARDMFALLPIQRINVTAMDEVLNTSTGHVETVPILSVTFDRSNLQRLNFDNIDCSDAIKGFKHNMKFAKTKGFSPVEKL